MSKIPDLEYITSIPIKVLQSVKTIITHAHCPDGLASAILLHDVLPKAQIVFATHDQLATLPATEGMLFCDIAPTIERVGKFMQVGAIVLDHHKTARPVVDTFANHGRGVYADNETELGVSGAVLAFREVWSRLKRKATLRPREGEIEVRNAERFAQLVGIRDTFDKRNAFDWEEAWKLSAGLMFQAQDKFLLSSSGDLFWPDEWNEWFHDTMILGEAVNAHNHRSALQTATEGFRFVTPKGKSVLIVQGIDKTTLLGDMKLADLVVGFQYRRDEKSKEPRFQISMRSQGIVDVAAIAKLYGGGGHTNAAGFTIEGLPDFNPIDMIKLYLRKSEV